MTKIEEIDQLKAELEIAELAERVAGEFDYVTGVDEADYIVTNLFDCDREKLLQSLEDYQGTSYNIMEEIVSGIKDDIIALT